MNSAMFVLFWPFCGFFLSFEASSVKNPVLASKKGRNSTLLRGSPLSCYSHKSPHISHNNQHFPTLKSPWWYCFALNTTHWHCHLTHHYLPLPPPVFVMSGICQNPNPINPFNVIAGRNVLMTNAMQTIIVSNKDWFEVLKESTDDAVCKINEKKDISRKLLLVRNLLLSDAREYRWIL